MNSALFKHKLVCVQGRTMLHLAQSEVMVRQLLLAGADPTIKDHAGNLPGGKAQNGQNLLHAYGNQDEQIRAVLLTGHSGHDNGGFSVSGKGDQKYDFLTAKDKTGNAGAVLSFSERQLYDRPDRHKDYGRPRPPLPRDASTLSPFWWYLGRC